MKQIIHIVPEAVGDAAGGVLDVVTVAKGHLYS